MSAKKKEPSQARLLYPSAIPAGMYDVQRTGANNHVMKTRRMVDYGTITSSNAANTFTALSFLLSSVEGYTEFITLYDQYRIDKIEVWLKSQQHAIPTTSVVNTGNMIVVVDYDDDTTPTSTGALLQYENSVFVEPQEDYYVEFQPHLAIAAYRSAGFNGYANQKSQWVDSINADVKHYGFKLGVGPDALGGSNHNSWHVVVRYNMSFRNLR